VRNGGLAGQSGHTVEHLMRVMGPSPAAGCKISVPRLARPAIGRPRLSKAIVTICSQKDRSEYSIPHETDAGVLAWGGLDTVLGSQYAKVACPSPSDSAVSPPLPTAMSAICRARLSLFMGAAGGTGTGVT
jgi:hypothetical protein